MIEIKEKKKQDTKHITKKMATAMAEDIKTYWSKQGHNIEVWVERISDGNARDYAVRSNLYNGGPASTA
tara:strand:- start:38 stop:244 length:207 start_codon:yes stop_codon:yes gene_type:complete